MFDAQPLSPPIAVSQERESARPLFDQLHEWIVTVDHKIRIVTYAKPVLKLEPSSTRPQQHAPACMQSGLPPSVSAVGAEHNPPLSFALQSIHVHHPYLAERRITPETAEHFGIGLFAGQGCMQGRVVIPIHDDGGRLVAYAGRA